MLNFAYNSDRRVYMFVSLYI